MAKAGFFIFFGVVGATLAYPLAYDYVNNSQEDIDNRDLELFARQDPLGPVFGAIGTALVPAVNAILGPILTNIATGISNAFNNNNKPATAATPANSTTTTTARPSRVQPNLAGDGLLGGQPAFVVRIPGSDEPLYLYSHPLKDSSGLPAVGPDTPVLPLNFAKLDAHASESDDEGVAVESADFGSGDAKPTQATKRHGQPRPKTETAHA